MFFNPQVKVFGGAKEVLQELLGILKRTAHGKHLVMLVSIYAKDNVDEWTDGLNL